MTADLPASTVDRWQAAIDALAAGRQQQIIVRPVSLPHTAAALPAYYIIAAAEASSNLARYDGIRYGALAVRTWFLSNTLTTLREPFSFVCSATPQARGASERRMGWYSCAARHSDRKCSGAFSWARSPCPPGARTDLSMVDTTRSTSAYPSWSRHDANTAVKSCRYYDSYFAQAQRVRRRVLDDFAKAFGEVDVLLTPTTPTTANPARDDAALADAVRALGNDTPQLLHPAVAAFLGDVFTVPASLAGLPAISVPGPTGVPDSANALGLQVIGPARSDRALLRVATALEQVWTPA